MTQKTIKNFINEIHSKPPKKSYPTHKTNVYNIDNFWTSDILDLKDYGLQNIKAYRYVLVVIKNFAIIGWTVPLEIENAQTMRDSLEKVLLTSKKLNLIETDHGKDFCNNFFQKFRKNNNIKHYSRNTSLGAVFCRTL